MRHSGQLLMVFLLGFQFLTAQNMSDFSARVENSYLKLYENPETALHAAKEIRKDNDRPRVQDILAQAYLLQGNYLESVRVSFEKTTTPLSEQELLKNLISAREFYALNLYDQTSKVLAPIISGKAKAKKSASEQILLAKLYQLSAQNFIALRNLAAARKSLQTSTEFAPHLGFASKIILGENELLHASILAEKGNRAEALKITDQLLQEFSTPRTIYLRSQTLQLRGNLFFADQKYTKAVEALQEALAPIEILTYEPLKKTIYGDLSKNFLMLNDNEQYDLYKNKYNKSSSLLENNKKEARRELIHLRSALTKENNQLILQNKREHLFFFLAILVLLLLLAGYFYLREIQKAKSLNRQISYFRKLSFHPPLVKEKTKEKELVKKQLFIPKEKELNLLEKLEQFEQSKNYLDNNMSLATLAAHLETNTKYLSEIINKYKYKNFNTYINELRVQHVIHLLSTNPAYLQYKISYIAEVGGFTSHSAFTNVFKSITGMSPQEYMQTLRNQQL